MVYQFAIENRRSEHIRPRWKVTFRSAPVLSYVLTRQWQVTSKVYRWKWLATLAARWHASVQPQGVIGSALVEPFLPGSNVVSFECSSPWLGEAFSSATLVDSEQMDQRRRAAS